MNSTASFNIAQNNDGGIKEEFSKMILSASGWRKIFVESGNEEDGTDKIKQHDAAIIYYAAVSFLEFLKTENKNIDAIVIGRDARPTGAVIEELFIDSLSSCGYDLKVIGCAAAPEIMAYSKSIGAAFIYISASHNPIGHNGIKFGLNTGGVINAEQSKVLIKIFTEKCNAKDAEREAFKILSQRNGETLKIKEKIETFKKEALAAYKNFSKEVITNSSCIETQENFFTLCKKNSFEAEKAGKPLSILVDFNGSARAASIDREFFKEAGISLIGIAEKAGDIRHAILPEGKNLKFCADKMEELHKTGSDSLSKNCFLGYMPDCDGDRGNIIYWNDELNRACILEAQEVFTLSVIAELAYLLYTNNENMPGMNVNKPIAVAVNGPTSLRIEEAAACFGAKVFRAEVGEANVVNLAEELRRKGFTVRILGEGSNGGNITYPSSVRDPINTVFALLKLLLIKSENGKKGLFHIWCEVSGNKAFYKESFSLTDILKTLPAYMTTPTGEKRALLKIRTLEHSVLKRRYQKIFEKEWCIKKDVLKKKFGIEKYLSFCNNGTVQQENLKDFGVSGKGGLKIQFYNSEDKPIAFIWMRGSGTESVFRIMADIKGASSEAEKYLVGWQGEMVIRADNEDTI
ncbi:phosphoglucomutase [Treponema pedis]|uniref:phosphoglucomutase n=1 Tax=Treponema pedis TaxID=409322 RepID=UPI00042886C0|nr:phosphoglucomutase [Treponema pedis]